MVLHAFTCPEHETPLVVALVMTSDALVGDEDDHTLWQISAEDTAAGELTVDFPEAPSGFDIQTPGPRELPEGELTLYVKWGTIGQAVSFVRGDVPEDGSVFTDYGTVSHEEFLDTAQDRCS